MACISGLNRSKSPPCADFVNCGGGCAEYFWEDEFCQRLAESERFVVRFDNRDTGLSDSVDFESSPYTINDMAADAIPF